MNTSRAGKTGIAAETTETKPPAGGHLSNSQLNSFSDCGEKYRLAYLEKIPKEPQGALIGGIAVHDAIDHAYREGWMADPDANRDRIIGYYLEILDAAIAKAGGPSTIRWAGRKTKAMPEGENADFWRGPDAIRMLQRAGEVATADAEAGTVWWSTETDPYAGLELAITVPFSEAYAITGRIDQLMVDANGEMFVRDWATGKPGGKTPVQGALYAEVLARADGFGFEVARVEYAYLRGATLEIILQSFDPTPLRAAVLRNFEALERGIQAEAFIMKPGPFCKGCEVRSACDYGKTIDAPATNEGSEK